MPPLEKSTSPTAMIDDPLTKRTEEEDFNYEASQLAVTFIVGSVLAAVGLLSTAVFLYLKML